MHAYAFRRAYVVASRLAFLCLASRRLTSPHLTSTLSRLSSLAGTLEGSKAGPSGIRPDQLTEGLFDYIFLHAPYDAAKCGGVDEKTLQHLRREFEFWYPVDLRVSGKDLVGNHLTMALYHHAAVWPEAPQNKWPAGIYANGHVMVDNQKMSKSLGK